MTLCRTTTPSSGYPDFARGDSAGASWFQHDFDTAIFLVTERLVHPGALFERNGMRDYERRVDLTFLNALQ
jgi:hypothetical protein